MCGMFTQYNPYAYISKDEYDAAEWIKNNVPSTAYILTDPGSGYVIRGLALRNASTYFILPDGRMPADSSTLYPGLDSKIRVFLSSQTGSEWAGIRDWLRFDQIYIVVTTRTVSWTLSTSDFAITQPIDGVDLLPVTSKFREPYFHEMYASNTVAILKYD
jgi:hypothetical protein